MEGVYRPNMNHHQKSPLDVVIYKPYQLYCFVQSKIPISILFTTLMGNPCPEILTPIYIARVIVDSVECPFLCVKILKEGEAGFPDICPYFFLKVQRFNAAS